MEVVNISKARQNLCQLVSDVGTTEINRLTYGHISNVIENYILYYDEKNSCPIPKTKRK